jgi:hypothetical protein
MLAVSRSTPVSAGDPMRSGYGMGQPGVLRTG